MAFRKRITKKRRTGARRVHRKKTSKGLRKAIKQVLSRQTETKAVVASIVNTNIYNISAPAFAVDGVNPVSPYTGLITIPQGVGSADRVGNSIKTMRCTMKGCFLPLQYDITTNNAPRPMIIKQWFFYAKTTPASIVSPVADFFDANDGETGMSGLLSDCWKSVNTEKYHVLFTKEFKVGNQNYVSAGGQQNKQYFTNNDFPLFQRFSYDLTKHMVKNVTYNDANTTPTSRILLCMTQVMSADNTSVAANQVQCAMSFQIEYKYKDA